MTDRVVVVNPVALAALTAAGIKPPEKEGEQFNLHDLDVKLAASGLDVSQRMSVKLHLRDCGLLTAGRVVDLSLR